MHGTGGRSRSNSSGAVPEQTRTVGTVEHCSCGMAALVVTAVAVVLLYSSLVAVTTALGLLGSTMLVLVVFAAWFGTWLLLEVAWEWHAGRLHVRE
ncbi:hypothetical protein [Haloglomus halophilum]|uniref:hypothetical protein n=1 Tax=Haloglomus halophilum TaxID=2962672 RepID=UPI0020C9C601|nr:hypothetical protein [Haloglomus halophilum]